MLKWIFLVIVVFVLWAYIRFTYKIPENIVILQTSLQDFTLKMLLEKQPIVVQDRVENIQPVWDGWFKYNKVSSFEIKPELGWIRNRYKHMLLHGLEDGEVTLCYPLCKLNNRVPDITEEVITIKLYKGMSLIVPYRWYLATDKPLYACGVHDLFTYMLPIS